MLSVGDTNDKLGKLSIDIPPGGLLITGRDMRGFRNNYRSHKAPIDILTQCYLLTVSVILYNCYANYIYTVVLGN